MKKKYRDELSYGVYLIRKGNVDYVKVYNMYEPYDGFVFYSNLPYSLDSIILAFEELLQTELTREFLNGYLSGINLHIIGRDMDNFKYRLFYMCKIDGINYIVYYDDEVEELIKLKSS